MALTEVTFPSFNERDTVHGWIYGPVPEPRGIVQLVHGFGEHSRRYSHLIQTLNDAGFVVAADDHVGHGKTAVENGTWGDPGDKGCQTTVEDERRLSGIAREAYPGLPFLLFGHSWGSMIAREYAARWGSDLAGLALCGVISQFAALEAAAPAITAAAAEGRGTEDGLELAFAIFGPLTERYVDPRTPNDWLAVDADVVADHARDPLNNFTALQVRMIHDLWELYQATEASGWADRVPAGLPIYLIAGDQDPVGNYGQGVYRVAGALWSSDHRHVWTRVYTGFRHEIHNERAIRGEVEQGILGFFDLALDAVDRPG